MQLDRNEEICYESHFVDSFWEPEFLSYVVISSYSAFEKEWIVLCNCGVNAYLSKKMSYWPSLYA